MAGPMCCVSMGLCDGLMFPCQGNNKQVPGPGISNVYSDRKGNFVLVEERNLALLIKQLINNKLST